MMDVVKIAQEFGAYAAFAVFLAWWLKSSLTDRIAALEAAYSAALVKLDEVNRYIRTEQAEMIAEAHVRERELVAIIRRDREHAPPPACDPSEEDTQKLMAVVKGHHAKTTREGVRLKGISGLP